LSHVGLCGALDAILFSIGSGSRATSLPGKRQAFQKSPTFIGYGNVILGELDKGELLEL
jgi:hypothetical protein